MVSRLLATLGSSGRLAEWLAWFFVWAFFILGVLSLGGSRPAPEQGQQPTLGLGVVTHSDRRGEHPRAGQLLDLRLDEG